jgi:hypothetical protein
MSYYNCCGIRPKIWVITIVVVLDQKHSNISKKGGGITICVVLDQNSGNVMFYQLVANLQSMFPS